MCAFFHLIGWYSCNYDPNKKLVTANVLMLLGINPLLITIYWTVFSFATTDYNHKGDLADLAIVLGEVVFGYAFAFVVSATAALWSARVERRTSRIRVNTTLCSCISTIKNS